MTSEQIDAAMRACATRTPGQWRADWVGTNHFELTTDAVGESYWVLDYGEIEGRDLDYIAATTDPDTGYEAVLRELKAANERIVALEQAAQAAVSMGSVRS